MRGFVEWSAAYIQSRGGLQCSCWVGMGSGPQCFGSTVPDGQIPACKYRELKIKLMLIKSVWTRACGNLGTHRVWALIHLKGGFGNWNPAGSEVKGHSSCIITALV